MTLQLVAPQMDLTVSCVEGCEDASPVATDGQPSPADGVPVFPHVLARLLTSSQPEPSDDDVSSDDAFQNGLDVPVDDTEEEGSHTVPSAPETTQIIWARFASPLVQAPMTPPPVSVPSLTPPSDVQLASTVPETERGQPLPVPVPLPTPFGSEQEQTEAKGVEVHTEGEAEGVLEPAATFMDSVSTPSAAQSDGNGNDHRTTDLKGQWSVVSSQSIEPFTSPPAPAMEQTAARTRMGDTTDPSTYPEISVPFYSVPVQNHSAERVMDVPESHSPSPPTAIDQSVMNQIVREARVRFGQGETEMTLRLQPPQLGRLHMRLVWSGNELMAQMDAESQTVKHLIETNLPTLYQSLSEQGIRVDHVTVSVGQNFTASPFADANPFANNARSQESMGQFLRPQTTDHRTTDLKGQWSVVSGQWSVVSGQWSAVDYWA